MSDFYQRMQATSKRLIGRFAQGAVVYNEPGEPTGPDYDPQPGVPTPHSVSAVQAPERRKKQYIDGGYIVSTDILLAVSPFDVEPTQSGTISINGVEHQIVMVDNPTVEPASPLVWFLGCRR